MMQKLYSRVVGTLLTILACVLVAVIFSDVFCRYIFNFSLIWPEELARYLIIWIVFIGISAGIRENVHVRIDFVVKKLPKQVRTGFFVARNGGICFFFLYLTYYGLTYVGDGMHRLSLTLGFPIGYVYIGLVFGSILAVIAVVEETFLVLTKGLDRL